MKKLNIKLTSFTNYANHSSLTSGDISLSTFSCHFTPTSRVFSFFFWERAYQLQEFQHLIPSFFLFVNNVQPGPTGLIFQWVRWTVSFFVHRIFNWSITLALFQLVKHKRFLDKLFFNKLYRLIWLVLEKMHLVLESRLA